MPLGSIFLLLLLAIAIGYGTYGAVGPQGIFNYGKAKLHISCPKIGDRQRRCGRFGATREQCDRFRCCWTQSKSEGKRQGLRCVQPTHNILNYIASPTFEQWSEWGQCVGMSVCAPGMQNRYRRCDGTVCQGHTRETQTCLTLGCKTEITIPATEASTSSTTTTSRIPMTTSSSTSQSTISSTTPTTTAATSMLSTTAAVFTTSVPATSEATTGIAWASWSAWSMWSPCTTTPEPLCLSGTKTRNRDCILNGEIVPGTTLGCERSHSSETSVCDTGLCIIVSPWQNSSCSTTCGSGIYTSVRFCAIGGNASPASCYTRTENCTGLPSCPFDSDIDLVVVMDTTILTDNCVSKAVNLGEAAPFTTTLIRQNFPNFFAQKDFIARFHDNWVTLNSQGLRLAVLGHSGLCSAVSSVNFYPLNFLNEIWNNNMLELMPMFCGNSDIGRILACADSGMFNNLRGDRAANENNVILMLPNPLSIPGYDFKYSETVLSFTKNSLLKNVEKIFLVSTSNLSALSQLEREAAEYRYNALGCFSYRFGSCVRYIGHIYESPIAVMMRMMTILGQQ